MRIFCEAAARKDRVTRTSRRSSSVRSPWVALSIICTLGIGYVIWSLIIWERGTTPAKSLMGMRVITTADRQPAGWGTMFLREAIYKFLICDLILSFTFIGPLVYKVGINDIDFKARLAGPSWQHPLGTDDLGRDLLARMLYGGRISLAVGLAAMLTAISIGVLIGAIAGMSRGWVDTVLM